MKTIIALAAAAAAAASALPASAQTSSTQVVRVRIADLDLGSSSGRAALDNRIRAAVHEACGIVSTSDPRGANHVYRCQAEARARLNSRRDAILAARGSSGELAARR